MDKYRNNNLAIGQEEYLMNNRLFQTIVHFMPIGVSVINSQLECVLCNEFTCELFGCQTATEYFNKFKELSPKYQPDGSLSVDGFSKHFNETSYGENKVVQWTHCDVHGNLLPTKLTLTKINLTDEYGGDLLVGYLQDMRPITLEKETQVRFNKRLKAILDASPLCLNLWTRDLVVIMCNKKAYTLYDLKDEEEYIKEFFNLSPHTQPNGRISSDLAQENLQLAIDTGYHKFKWLHHNLVGEEIPCEITIVKIKGDDNADDLLAGFTRDLRDGLAGNDNHDEFETYFYNQISDRALLSTLAELSDELFFALDIRTSIIQYFGNMRSLLNIDGNNTTFPDSIIEHGAIYPGDIPKLHKVVQNIHNGISEPVDIRVMQGCEIPHYFRVSYEIISNTKNEPIFVVGKAVDIHNQKELEVKATTDLLTACYNKISTEVEISRIIDAGDNTSKHMLFIVDIDNFKAVNDSLGHHFGDLVLKEVASKLKHHFRSQDIVGRIGGDEFIVLAKNMADINMATLKAEEISDAFKDICFGENSDYKISLSIGAACFPYDGLTYNDLYKRADKALYESKKRGKSCFTFYSDTILETTMNKHKISMDNAKVESASFDTRFVLTIFDLFYESDDIKDSVGVALNYLGERLDIDRCYILESFDEGTTYCDTFEWCKEGIASKFGESHTFSKEILDDCLMNADDEGVVRSDNLSRLATNDRSTFMNNQDVQSFLHVQTREKGFVKDFIGVDDCMGTRTWREKEINTIIHVKKIISLFLSKLELDIDY